MKDKSLRRLSLSVSLAVKRLRNQTEIMNYEAISFKYCEFVLILTLIIRQAYRISSAAYYIATVACLVLLYFKTLFRKRL
jgi:hypothetical protein